MITREEYQSYVSQETEASKEVKRFWALCFHCKKIITDNKTRWSLEKRIQKCGGKSCELQLYFHHECMLEVAGEKYDIEEPEPDPFEPF